MDLLNSIEFKNEILLGEASIDMLCSNQRRGQAGKKKVEQKQLNILLEKTPECVRVVPVTKPINADAVVLGKAGGKNVLCVAGDKRTKDSES